MELDETDPAVWLKLEASVQEYIQNNSHAFKNVCERLLLPYQNNEKWSENIRIQHYPKSKGSSAGTGTDFCNWFQEDIFLWPVVSGGYYVCVYSFYHKIFLLLC